MDDRNDEVLKQYDLTVQNMYRARGAFILETNKGLKLYKSFVGSKNRAEFEQFTKQHLIKKGYDKVDCYVRNQEGELITRDSYGTGYIIKDWFRGEECNLRSLTDVVKAVKNLAKLHIEMNQILLSEDDIQYNMFQDVEMMFQKHNRELKRVRSYMKEKRQKNEFELCFLAHYDKFYEQGVQALSILQSSNYHHLLEYAKESSTILHGNYTYHNILILQNNIATTNFDKAQVGIQILDIYQFMRKVLEKNDWDLNLGSLILEEYSKVKDISKEESKLLYVLHMYPEKFWKITNFYYNNKKSWIPQKNIKKLEGIGVQKKKKDEFLAWLRKEGME